MRAIYVGFVLICLGLSSCRQAPESDHFTGYVEADFVVIAAPVAGWLVNAPFAEGDDVVEGDVLFQLDDDREQAELAESEARLAEAQAQARDKTKGARAEEIARLEAQLEERQADLVLAASERKRWVALVTKGHASEERADQVIAEHEAAKARVATAKKDIEVARLMARQDAVTAAFANESAAEAALANARWRLSQRQVVARVGGFVEEVVHHSGEYVTAGSPVLTLLPPAGLKVRFFVPQARLPELALGDRVRVHADGLADPAEATVAHIARTAEFTPPVIYSAATREKLVFLVEADLTTAQGLHPGLPVEVRLP